MEWGDETSSAQAATGEPSEPRKERGIRGGRKGDWELVYQYDAARVTTPWRCPVSSPYLMSTVPRPKRRLIGFQERGQGCRNARSLAFAARCWRGRRGRRWRQRRQVPVPGCRKKEQVGRCVPLVQWSVGIPSNACREQEALRRRRLCVHARTDPEKRIDGLERREGLHQGEGTKPVTNFKPRQSRSCFGMYRGWQQQRVDQPRTNQPTNQPRLVVHNVGKVTMFRNCCQR